MSQGFSHFSGYLHNFLLAKLVTSSIRVKDVAFVFDRGTLHTSLLLDTLCLLCSSDLSLVEARHRNV